MFPNKSGGVALYAHEAWRKYLTLIGPLATFGYWIGWSVVLSVNGLVAGVLLQSEFFSSSDWSHAGAGFTLTLPVVFGCGLIVVVWLFNVFGVRPAVWFGYVTGALLCIPAFVLMFLPYITGDWSSSNMTWLIGSGGGVALVLVWLYFMCWSAYGIEVVATFAPEFHDTEKDTPKALRSSALFCAAVYALLPLGLGGTLGTDGGGKGHDVHRVLLRRVQRDRRQRARQGDDPLHRRRPRALDEHGDDGRVARAVRHRQGRDDDPPARASSTATTCRRWR